MSVGVGVELLGCWLLLGCSAVSLPAVLPALLSDLSDNASVPACFDVRCLACTAEYAGDKSVLLAFDEVVAPAARRFAPDIILVSAGFDAHWRDPFEALQFK